MRQLENIITKLKSDPFYAVTITNQQNFRVIGTNLTGAKMGDLQGGVEEYFNSIYDSGVKIIGIEIKRKNGSTFKSMDEFVTITFQDETTAPTAQPFSPTQPETIIPGLAAPGLHAGLNQMDVTYKFMDYNRVISDNASLKADNKRLQDEVDRLRLADLENKFSESKANGTKEMLTGLLPVLMQTLPALLGKAPVPDAAGLGTPVGMPQVSESKAMLIQQLMGQSDAVCDNLYVIFEAMTTNADFATELIQLLEKFQLTS